MSIILKLNKKHTVTIEDGMLTFKEHGLIVDEIEVGSDFAFSDASSFWATHLRKKWEADEYSDEQLIEKLDTVRVGPDGWKSTFCQS